MAIQKYEDMSSMELDIIKEIGSIGSGNAATALSSMLNTKVKMGIPEVSILEFNGGGFEWGTGRSSSSCYGGDVK